MDTILPVNRNSGFLRLVGSYNYPPVPLVCYYKREFVRKKFSKNCSHAGGSKFKFLRFSRGRGGGETRQIACKLMNLIQIYSNFKKTTYYLLFSQSIHFTITFKRCLYVKRLDSSLCPHGIFRWHFAEPPLTFRLKRIPSVTRSFAAEFYRKNIQTFISQL